MLAPKRIEANPSVFSVLRTKKARFSQQMNGYPLLLLFGNSPRAFGQGAAGQRWGVRASQRDVGSRSVRRSRLDFDLQPRVALECDLGSVRCEIG